MARLQLLHNDSEGVVEAQREGQLVWRYRYLGVPKPHVHPFATPRGEVVSLAAPHDHIHHRGLMLAWRVNEVNFWEETPQTPGELNGLIRHEAWDEMSESKDGIVLREKLHWIDSRGHTHLLETRCLRVCLDEARQAVGCLWESRFTAPEGRAVISGRTPWSKISYYGLGFRFARALDQGGTHLDSEGRSGQESANGLPARWHSYAGHLDETGTPVGVLICDASTNPRHPSSWFHINHPPAPFAYVTASLIAHEDYTLEPQGELILKYGVWVHEGKWDAQVCAKVWAQTFSL